MLIGLGIWLLGLAIESVADVQKYRFNQRISNKDKWIASGLWRYSRHPNYFGDILVWIGIYYVAASVLSPAEAFIGLVSPLFIAGLIMFASGIPILEKSADARWGKLEAYKSYKKRTSILTLWPPKKT